VTLKKPNCNRCSHVNVCSIYHGNVEMLKNCCPKYSGKDVRQAVDCFKRKIDKIDLTQEQLNDVNFYCDKIFNDVI